MTHLSTNELFLIAMTLIFTVPYLIWRFGRTDYFAPLVVVQILTGILLGPGVLGAAFPDYYSFVFTQPVTQSLNGIASWAVMVFVWIAGIELDLAKAWQHRRESTVTAGLALGVPLLHGLRCGIVYCRHAGLDGRERTPLAIHHGRWHVVRGDGIADSYSASGKARDSA